MSHFDPFDQEGEEKEVRLFGPDDVFGEEGDGSEQGLLGAFDSDEEEIREFVLSSMDAFEQESTGANEEEDEQGRLDAFGQEDEEPMKEEEDKQGRLDAFGQEEDEQDLLDASEQMVKQTTTTEDEEKDSTTPEEEKKTTKTRNSKRRPRQPSPVPICFGEQERMLESDVARVLNDPVIQGLDEDAFRKAVLTRIGRIAKSSSWKPVTLPLADRVLTTCKAAIVKQSSNIVTFSSFAYDQSMMFEAGAYSVPEDDDDDIFGPAPGIQRLITRREVPCVQDSKCLANLVIREIPGQSFTMMAYWAPGEEKPSDEVLAQRKCILCHRYDMQILTLVVPSSFSDSLSKDLADAHLQRVFNVSGPGEYRPDCLLPVITNGALIQSLATMDFSRLVVKTKNNRRYVCQELMQMSNAPENTLNGYPGTFPIAYSVTKNQQGGAKASHK